MPNIKAFYYLHIPDIQIESITYVAGTNIVPDAHKSDPLSTSYYTFITIVNTRNDVSAWVTELLLLLKKSKHLQYSTAANESE